MRRAAYLLFFLIVLTTCRKPYNPPAITGKGSFLVVEGIVNSGTDSTTITLSRTVNVSSDTVRNPVLNAHVAVISDQNVVFPLTETTNGNYVAAGLNLDVTGRYRLSIKTTNEEYQSDLVPVNKTPPIDSVGFNIENVPATGIQIYANTHDASNGVKYYRWDYNEEWAFRAKYPSNFISNGTAIVPRTTAQNISICYTGDASSNIVLGTSAKLTQNIIYQNPVIFIPSTSEKIEDEYSILVKQYALTADAYTFYTSLKKNTEQLGSIFDAQPSELVGNIHCITHPSEPVIGYVSVCTVSTKRIFILNSQLPTWEPTYPYTCQQDTELYCVLPECRNDVLLKLIPPGSSLIPTVALCDAKHPCLNPQFPPGYLASTVECVDCTIRGSKTPPPFWK
jgi:hypothetical protein